VESETVVEKKEALLLIDSVWPAAAPDLRLDTDLSASVAAVAIVEELGLLIKDKEVLEIRGWEINPVTEVDIFSDGDSITVLSGLGPGR
jgi:hypothetical protein